MLKDSNPSSDISYPRQSHFATLSTRTPIDPTSVCSAPPKSREMQSSISAGRCICKVWSLLKSGHLGELRLDAAASFYRNRYSSHQPCNCRHLVVVIWRRRPRIARQRNGEADRCQWHAVKALEALKITVLPTVIPVIGSNSRKSLLIVSLRK